MIIGRDNLNKHLPLPPTDKWMDGVWDIEAFRHGKMSLIYFSPEGIDYQTAHDQDEIYIVLEGSGVIEIDGASHAFSSGAAIFVAAGKQHRFIGNLSGIRMWAVLYGPKGGE